MKIAIHHRKNSFSEDWIDYCKKKNIQFKIVDCYRNEIVNDVENCDIVMWHFHHADSKDSLFAKQLLFSLQLAGKKVFPDFHTAWHFDDKVGQKYLLEAISAPFVSTYVFYDRDEAMNWVDKTSFPKVFKLRRGAGSAHVKLIEHSRHARQLVKRAFGKGFSQYAGWSNLEERLRKYYSGSTDYLDVLKGLVRLCYPTEYARMAGREKGYIYFQEFIPGNDHDVRVVVIGKKAFAIKRMVREGDFRASGNDEKYTDRHLFKEETIELAFKISEKLNIQCIAFDFIYDNGKPLIVEISYGFRTKKVSGYWDRDLNWHEGTFSPQHWMLESLLINVKA